MLGAPGKPPGGEQEVELEGVWVGVKIRGRGASNSANGPWSEIFTCG